MKTCPFCAEQIQDEAIKCRFCGEFLDGRGEATAAPREATGEKVAWYFRTSTLVFAFCIAGPLMLPLVWWHPQLSRTWKTVWTVLVVAATWALYQATLLSIDRIKQYYEMLSTF